MQDGRPARRFVFYGNSEGSTKVFDVCRVCGSRAVDKIRKWDGCSVFIECSLLFYTIILATDMLLFILFKKKMDSYESRDKYRTMCK